MMKSIRHAAVAGLVVAISGCSTITFTNGQPAASDEQYSQWHHNLAYSLYEYSPPVAPDKECTGDWSSVTVEHDVITVIAGSVVLGGALWDPWMVTINCAE
ncbi:MAG: hypothetical protein P8X74_22660 [Reinekea sp.]|jgi:hypothetical protein